MFGAGAMAMVEMSARGMGWRGNEISAGRDDSDTFTRSQLDEQLTRLRQAFLSLPGPP